MKPIQRITASGLSIEGYEDEDKLIASIACMIDNLRAEKLLPHGLAYLRTKEQAYRAEKYFDILCNGEFRCEVVHSGISRKDRKQWIDDKDCDFRLGKINVIFNVRIAVAGYDFPIIKFIWILRKPKNGDIQQVFGRGTRLHELKDEFLIYDFVGAIEDAELEHNDLFNPVVTAKITKDKADKIVITCPQCSGRFKATLRPNPNKYGINETGNFTDMLGVEIVPTLPAHFARTCAVEIPLVKFPKSISDYQIGCGYRFLAKECSSCGCLNDITANYCEGCGAELINVNRDIQLQMATVSGDKMRLKVIKYWFAKELRQSDFDVSFYLPVGFKLDGLEDAVWLNPKEHELDSFKSNIPTHLTVKWSAKKSKWQVLEKVVDFIK